MIVAKEQREVCIAALRLAAVQNALDAKRFRDMPCIAAHFLQQSREAGRLADRVESRGVEEALS